MAKRLWELFYTFAKVGVMTFGGGYAMLPILQREVVENKGWATEEELADWFAIGQCTPGIIAVNTATFVGQGLAGTIGGIADSYMSKSKAKSLDAKLAKGTKWVGAAFIVLTLVINCMLAAGMNA